jgi:hypothetical protein
MRQFEYREGHNNQVLTMKKETIREYTILFQYLLLLKEPTYIFLTQILQHLSPATWWEDFIEPVLQRERKENFKYLDLSDLLNVLKMNWERIWRYLDNNYQKYKYNNEYKMVNKVHRIRTIVAHANDIDMSPFIFTDSLACLLEYARLIRADNAIAAKLELDWHKAEKSLPETVFVWGNEETLKTGIISLIEEKVLLSAVNHETLPPDIKLSIDRTTLRLHSKRTLDEIMEFFNNAIRSERGMVVQDVLHQNGLSGFEDIKDEINLMYTETLKEKNE